MLQTIRDRAQGWLAGIIVGLICIPFALWGINEYFGIFGNVIVAEVDGQKISFQEFQRVYQQYRQQIQALAGANLDINQFNEDRLKQQVLNQMVEANLLLQYPPAKSWWVLQQVSLQTGLRISDGQVAAAINSLAVFQRDGAFANDLYEQRLQAMGLTPSAFEEQLRRDLLTEQLRQGVASSAFVIAQELNWITRMKGQKWNIAYTILSAEPLKSSIQVTNKEIENYYNEHRDRYMTPELVKIAYIDLSLDTLARQVVADDQVLRNYYETHQPNYAVAEQRSINYILVRIPKEASAQEVEAARKKSEELATLSKQDESFEKIAEKHSEEQGLKIEVGQTGFFSRGVMEPAFDEAAFSMKPGEISNPVRTDFGFHVIQLNEIKEGGTKPFEEVRSEVEQAYRHEQAEHLFIEQAEQLANLTFENPDTLEVASQALGLEIKESDYFPRTGGVDVTAEAKVIEVAFSPEVLEEGVNSEPLELGNNRLVILRMRDHKPAAPRKLDEVRNEIIDQIKFERAKNAILGRGQKLLEQLKSGKDRATLAKQEQLQWQEASGVDRQDPNVNRAILRTAFKLGRPSEGSPLYGGVALGAGDYALVAILSVQDPEPGTVDEKVRKETRDQLLRSISSREWQDFMAELRRHANIEIYAENL